MNMRVCFLILGLCILSLFVPSPVAAQDQFNTAGALYSKSVDLANEGKYQEALTAADQALALNASPLIPLIQTNRAGILVMLGRYDEAVSAADIALSARGNLTTTFSIAYFNKGDALRHLGRTDEAQVAFAKAQELDPSLTPPDMYTPVTPALPASAKSPPSGLVVFAGLACGCGLSYYFRYKMYSFLKSNH
jgi:tetratricopeptide (TPR) repeat protein